MKVGIVGTRGIPAKYGGFETFAQEVSPLFVKNGFEVTVYCDKNDNKEALNVFKGVKLKYQKTTKTKHSLLYYMEGIFQSLKENDVILITGTGGAFFYLLNLFFKKKIITNTDGIESRREKWSLFKKKVIKLSEFFTIRFSTHIVADSKSITNYLLMHYSWLKKDKITTIEYGAPINNICLLNILRKHDLFKNQYYLVVARLEPENNIKMIIEAFLKSRTDKQLIIIGNLIKTDYVKSIKKYSSDKIKFLGGIYNKDELKTVRSAAFAYIHGHSVGGTNPSLLEALGSSNISLCHDNIFNREVTDNTQLYFSSSEELVNRIQFLENMDFSDFVLMKKAAKDRIENYYTWEYIAYKYTKLFNRL